MAKIQIKEFIHNSFCDIAGCRNRATKALGREGQPIHQNINICDQCYKEIIDAAPEDLIINRAMELTKDAAEDEGVIDAIKGDDE